MGKGQVNEGSKFHKNDDVLVSLRFMKSIQA
jgi:hypothetical protein